MFKDMKLKTRLILQAVLLITLIVLMGIFGVRAIRVANLGTQKVYMGGVDSVEYLNKLKNLFRFDVIITSYRVEDGTLSFGEGNNIVTQALSNIPKNLEEYLKTEATTDEKEIRQRLKSIINAGVSLIEKLSAILKSENREKLVYTVKYELLPATQPIINEIDNLIEAHVLSTKSDFEESQKVSGFYENLMLAMIAIVIPLAWLFSDYIIRSVTTPLAKTGTILDRLSLGDHSVQIEIDSRDEIADMLSSLKRMVDSIKKMTVPIVKVSQGDLTGNVEERSENDLLAQSINNMIVQLRKMISETKEEILVIANAAEEVTSSITEVSAGTTETAAAVTETTTTVEELQQTAQVSSDKADDVLKTSEETLRVVKTSETSLKNTLDEMAHIQEKMNVISETIVKLSEHSLIIGDIINTVNELAEQSNLLAVNAAIEAAKAGEQGRGFGVVAQEIRSLAEQSKAATSQVRSMLNDIQNSTGTAIMATEQGTKAVNKGVKQSQETNTAMQSLISNITQVTQAAKQISISSRQQLIGVEQVRTAMTNINLASEQHVEHMKQIETAIVSLNEVTGNLNTMIGRYKISEGEAGDLKSLNDVARNRKNARREFINV